MAKLRAYSVYDSKAEAYLRPFFAPSRGLAIRSFADVVNDKTHEVNKHAADYTLFEIGDFDEATGLFISKTPETLGNALTFKHEET